MKKFLFVVLCIVIFLIVAITVFGYLAGNDKLPKNVQLWLADHPKLDKLTKAFVRHSLMTRLWYNVKEDYEILTEDEEDEQKGENNYEEGTNPTPTAIAP